MNNKCCETEYIDGLEAFERTELIYKHFNKSFNIIRLIVIHILSTNPHTHTIFPPTVGSHNKCLFIASYLFFNGIHESRFNKVLLSPNLVPRFHYLLRKEFLEEKNK